jgi:hypothetical protein
MRPSAVQEFFKKALRPEERELVAYQLNKLVGKKVVSVKQK